MRDIVYLGLDRGLTLQWLWTLSVVRRRHYQTLSIVFMPVSDSATFNPLLTARTIGPGKGSHLQRRADKARIPRMVPG